MALGFSEAATSGGDFLPIIKYSAQSGDFVRQERSNSRTAPGRRVTPRWRSQLAWQWTDSVQVAGCHLPMGQSPDGWPGRGEAGETEQRSPRRLRIRVYNKEIGVRSGAARRRW